MHTRERIYVCVRMYSVSYAPVRIDTRLFHVCTATSLSSAVGKCDAARREWMRTNHSINSVLYDPLDAILSNKADATYALNIAMTNATFDSVSSNIDNSMRRIVWGQWYDLYLITFKYLNP